MHESTACLTRNAVITLALFVPASASAWDATVTFAAAAEAAASAALVVAIAACAVADALVAADVALLAAFDALVAALEMAALSGPSSKPVPSELKAIVFPALFDAVSSRGNSSDSTPLVEIAVCTISQLDRAPLNSL